METLLLCHCQHINSQLTVGHEIYRIVGAIAVAVLTLLLFGYPWRTAALFRDMELWWSDRLQIYMRSVYQLKKDPTQ